MFKKLLLASASIALLSSSFTVSASQISSAAPYFGLEAGYDLSNLKNTFSSDLFSSTETTYNFGKHVNGYLGGAFAGYAWNFNNGFYLAGELSGEVNSNRHSDVLFTNVFQGDAAEIGFNSQKLYSVGFSVLPGFHVNTDSLIYGRVGTVYSRFKSNLYQTLDTGAILESTNKGGYNNGFWGMQLGLGYQVKIQPNLSLRAEYDYTDYRSRNFTLGIENSSIKANPYSNNAKLAVLYSF